MCEFSGAGYRIWIPSELPGEEPHNDNADVHVYLDNGLHYVATLYTPYNLGCLLEKWRASGEYGGGLYVWDPSMVVVRDLHMETIRLAVENLIATGDLHRAFQLADPD